MPKKQKRFTSEAAILKAIDAMEARRQKHLEHADVLEGSLNTLRPEEFPTLKDFTAEKDYRRKMANSSRRSAQKAESKKVELGKALAAFRTQLLPLGLDDNSVVL